ncbi:MAG TPA: sugar phosphate isomerase/epimerase family protein [Cyclobacteriaceae bacterium]|nr:sugar phosphate isomerase/epimerase family protein [Cyclobacteriaceae bacterium]
MPNTTRRKFLQTTAALMAVTAGSHGFTLKKKGLLLAFSTLGCPDWSFRQIVDFAARHQYSGLELRGLQRQIDLTKVKEFTQDKAQTLRMMADHQLKFVDLGSSATLHFSEAQERKKSLDDGRRFIDLAQELNCPYVRVFPNNLPKDQDKSATMDLIIKGLLELGDHAKGSKVRVLMESHGDLVHSDDLATVMKGAEHSNTGMIWDVTNMWTITQEDPKLVYPKLKKYIYHTHIKDAKKLDEKITYTRLGQGEVPIFEAIDLLMKGGYKGYYSFEWEKLWHPELEEPELALADYSETMRKHYN